jgi:hypothetical protein
VPARQAAFDARENLVARKSFPPAKQKNAPDLTSAFSFQDMESF